MTTKTHTAAERAAEAIYQEFVDEALDAFEAKRDVSAIIAREYAELEQKVEDIRKALADNAAPFKLDYALGQVDKIWIDASLMLDLFEALQRVRGQQ